jgi:hypothetical protein
MPKEHGRQKHYKLCNCILDVISYIIYALISDVKRAVLLLFFVNCMKTGHITKCPY